MSEARLDILTIGTLARNRFWDEKSDVREELATVSLVRSGDAVVVVDPGWPAEVLAATLFYRAGLKPEAVTHVFLTHVDPAHARGIAARICELLSSAHLRKKMGRAGREREAGRLYRHPR